MLDALLSLYVPLYAVMIACGVPFARAKLFAGWRCPLRVALQLAKVARHD